MQCLNNIRWKVTIAAALLTAAAAMLPPAFTGSAHAQSASPFGSPPSPSARTGSSHVDRRDSSFAGRESPFGSPATGTRQARSSQGHSVSANFGSTASPFGSPAATQVASHSGHRKVYAAKAHRKSYAKAKAKGRKYAAKR
jgi:hypothetical protein